MEHVIDEGTAQVIDLGDAISHIARKQLSVTVAYIGHLKLSIGDYVCRISSPEDDSVDINSYDTEPKLAVRRAYKALLSSRIPNHSIIHSDGGWSGHHETGSKTLEGNLIVEL